MPPYIGDREFSVAAERMWNSLDSTARNDVNVNANRVKEAGGALSKVRIRGVGGRRNVRPLDLLTYVNGKRR